MSIDDEIRARVADGRLVLHRPLLKGAQSRAIFVEATLYGEILAGASSVNPWAFRIGQLTRDLDRFSNGSPITVGYGRERTCFIKPLDPIADEIWELRSRDPKPSCRLFCRFAKTDVLIVLACVMRDQLGGERDPAWKAAIRDCKARWRRLFFPYDAHQGSSINDYIQHNVFVVGDIP